MILPLEAFTKVPVMVRAPSEARKAATRAVSAAVERRLRSVACSNCDTTCAFETPAFNDFDLSSLRVINTGGQKLQAEVKRRAERAIPACKVQEVFGMAEGLLCYVRLDDPDELRYETAGRPVSAGDELRLVDEQGNEVPDGEIGELLVRGPYTLRGYYRVPEYNARAFTADGFYKTGDLMRRHPSGNYIVEGRKKDVINRGGEKITIWMEGRYVSGEPRINSQREMSAVGWFSWNALPHPLFLPLEHLLETNGSQSKNALLLRENW